MKSRIFALLFVFCAPLLVVAQSVTVPQNVLDKFSADYPDATEAKWEKSGKDFEVEFTSAGDEMEVSYNKDAQVLEVEQTIPPRSVPDAVMDAFEASYPNMEAEEISRVQKGGLVYFELEFMENGKEVEVTFDENGNRLGEEVEEADDED